MEETANTFIDMVAGYTVIYLTIMIYVVSLVLRFRKLRREKAFLDEFVEE